MLMKSCTCALTQEGGGVPADVENSAGTVTFFYEEFIGCCCCCAGIVTLEDIMKVIIKTEIVEETSNVRHRDNITKEPVQRKPGENADVEVGCADVCVCVCARACARVCVCVSGCGCLCGCNGGRVDRYNLEWLVDVIPAEWVGEGVREALCVHVPTCIRWRYVCRHVRICLVIYFIVCDSH